MGQSLLAAPIELLRPKQPPDLSQLEIETNLNLSLSEGVELLGYAIPETSMLAGQSMPVYLFWRATADPEQDNSVKLELIDESGVSQQSARVPLVPGYPTNQWQSGDQWRGFYRLPLPASLDRGVYQLTMSTDAGEVISLETVVIDTPEHHFDPPVMTYAQEMGFGQVAKLAGYDLPTKLKPGNALPITLLWQSKGETPVNYKSFVQLLDDSGRLVVGSDAIPDEWRRPTTGWIEGEYITDRHHMIVPEDLKPGAYQILIGLYEVNSLERLLNDSGTDALILSQPIEIIEN